MGGIWPDFLTALILVGIGWSCSLLLLDRETIPRLLSSLNLGRLLHLSLESSDLGIWCYEHQQDRIFLDGRASLLLGLPTRAARLAEFLECVVPEDRERIRRIWLHPPTTAAPGTVEFRVGDSHRGLRHLSLSSGLPGRGGKRRRRSGAMAMGTLQDVTERKKVEIALRESEARFSTIFRTCPAGIALCRVADGSLVDVNPAFLHIYGLERQEVIGMTSFALHLWGSPQQREVALASILIDGRGYQSERSIRRPDGQVRHLLISVDLVFLDSERYLQWTLLDVTENRRSQALASRNEILTNAIMNSLDVAVAVLDREGNILRTNRKWSEFALGNGAGEELAAGVGLNYFEVCRRSFPEASATEALAGMQAVLEERLPVASIEYPCHGPAGERWYLLQATPLGSGLQGLVTIHMDITARRQAEEGLRQRLMLQDKLARVAASVPGVIYSIKLRPDGTFCIPYAMQGSVDIFGLRPEDLTEDLGPVLSRIHGADQERVLAVVLESARTMAPWHCEFRVHHPQGGVRWVESKAVPRLEDDGCVIWHGYIHDVSARKQADAELMRSRDQLRALNEGLQRVREEERSRISLEIHDQLGQSLTVLKLEMAWLRARLLGGQAEEKARLQEVGRLIDDTLRAVRTISWDLRPGILDTLGLGAGVEWLVDDFRRRLGIRCNVVVPRERLELPDVLATHLFRICQELLTNVARHAQANRIDVSLGLADGRVLLEVRDNGRGMPMLPAHGHSLGLLGIKERAAQCGGEVHIATRPEIEGTRVRVLVPLITRETDIGNIGH